MIATLILRVTLLVVSAALLGCPSRSGGGAEEPPPPRPLPPAHAPGVVIPDAALRPAPPAAVARMARVERSLLPGGDRDAPPASIDARMAQHRVPALSVAVIHGYALEWARAYGVADVRTRRPVDVHTVFQAASVSKPVAALGALALVQRGVISLDEDVHARLRAWRFPPSPALTRPITLRMLFTHSAGTTVHGFGGYPAGSPVPTVPQILAGAPPANSPPIVVERAPGEGVKYSGGGFTVAQQVLVDATGLPFPALLQETVLDPLGMRDSTYEQPLPEARAANAASGHLDTGAPLPTRWHVYPEMAAAGLWTTPADLARYAIELMRAHARLPTAVIAPGWGHVVLTAQAKGNVGLGIFFDGKGESLRWAHNGANAGFRALLVAFGNGDGAVLMANSDNGFALFDEIVAAIAAEYDWPALKARKRRSAADDDAVPRYADADDDDEDEDEDEEAGLRAWATTRAAHTSGKGGR